MAKDIVAKAKSDGISLSVAQMYTARSTAKPATRKHAAGGVGSNGRSSGAGNFLEFKRLVLALGLDQAEAYIREI